MLFRFPVATEKIYFHRGAEFVQTGICMGASLEGEQRHFFDEIASQAPI
jgi:hypothetical protein